MYLILLILGLSFYIINNRKSMDKVRVIFFTNLTTSILSYYLYLLSALNSYMFNSQSYEISIAVIIFFIIMIINLLFIVYLFKKRYWYTAPLVLLFWIYYGFFIDNKLSIEFVYLISIIGIVAIVSVQIFYSIAKKDGIIFSYGIFLSIYTIELFINLIFHSAILFFILSLLASLIFNLGTLTVFDVYLFYDREKRKEVRENWSSNKINIGEPVKQVEMENLEEKEVLVICPICNSRQKEKLSRETLNNIYNKGRSIVSIYIPKDHCCDHNFIAYMDKTFSIRGYAAIDVIIEKTDITL